MCHSTSVEAEGTLVGVSSAFPPCELQGYNSGHLAWLQGALVTEPSCWAHPVSDKVYHRLNSPNNLAQQAPIILSVSPALGRTWPPSASYMGANTLPINHALSPGPSSSAAHCGIVSTLRSWGPLFAEG